MTERAPTPTPTPTPAPTEDRPLIPRPTFDCTLTEHAAADPDARPVFTFRVPSVREQRSINACMAALQGLHEAMTDKEVEAAEDGVLSVLRAQLVGWQHVGDEEGRPLAFDPEQLDRVLTFPDLGELIGLVWAQGQVEASERKKSARQSLAAMASAASNDAEQGPSLNPAPSPPTPCNAPNATEASRATPGPAGPAGPAMAKAGCG